MYMNLSKLGHNTRLDNEKDTKLPNTHKIFSLLSYFFKPSEAKKTCHIHNLSPALVKVMFIFLLLQIPSPHCSQQFVFYMPWSYLPISIVLLG